MIKFIALLIIIVLVILILILVIPGYIVISYNSSFSVKVRILYIPITVFPVPSAIKIFKSKKIYPRKQKNNDKSTAESKTEKNNLKSLVRMLKLLKNLSKKILRHIRINSIYLDLGVGGGDASDIAINYERLNILISNILPILDNSRRIKKYKINIYPDFLESGNPIKFKISIRLNTIFIIYELLRFSFVYIKAQAEQRTA